MLYEVITASDGRLELVMERGPFGSGAHETTASCLQFLAELPQVRSYNFV